MKKIKIISPKAEYVPGEEITGFIELECDEPVDAKEVILEFVGEVGAAATGTERYYKGRPQQATKKMSRLLIHYTFNLLEDSRYEEGKHRIDFSFHLPDSEVVFSKSNYLVKGPLYPSYIGQYAWVRYSLLARMKVSKIKFIKAEIPIRISVPVGELSKNPVAESVYFNDQRLLDIESDSQLYCIGSPYELRYRYSTGMKINKIWFEINQNERTSVEGFNNVHSESLGRNFVSPEEDESFEWKSIVIPSSSSVRPIFISAEVGSSVALVVTIDISRFKKEHIVIPLLAANCPEKLKPIFKKKTGIQGEGGQNNCPHCGVELAVEGMIRPDGLVICPKCFKKFKPSAI